MFWSNTIDYMSSFPVAMVPEKNLTNKLENRADMRNQTISREKMFFWHCGVVVAPRTGVSII